ncbi:ribonuclease P protein component [Mycolicibacter minnesotensis]
MLPAHYRMRRSADFGATVRHGRKSVQPNIVIYTRQPVSAEPSGDDGVSAISPRVGLIIAKSVGSAVDRHRVARRLRHAARDLLGDLEPREHMVIRALPSSNGATSEALGRQLRAGLHSTRRPKGAVR